MTPYEILLSRVAGAHAGRGRARPGAPRSRPCAPSGSSAPRRSARSPTTASSGSGTTGSVVAAIPGQRLVDDCPIYQPEAREGEDARARRGARRPTARPTADLEGALELLLDSPNIASKRWVYEQYDSTVQASTVLGPGGDAGVLRVPGHRLRARGDGRLQQPAGRARSLRGRQGRRGRGGAQRRLHRRAAAGHHRLPQLRQPGEARGVLPVPRGLPRHRRRLPRVRHAGHRRQRLASTTRARPARSIRRPTVGMVGLLERVDDAGAEPLRRAGRRDRRPRRRPAASSGGSAYWAEVRDFVGGPARAGGSRRRAPAAALPGARPPTAAAPLGARLLRGRPARSRWPKRRSAGPTRRAGSARRVDLTATRRTCRRTGCSTARTAPGRSSPARPATSAASLALAGEHGVPAFRGRPGRRAPAARWNSGSGGRLFTWGIGALRQTYFDGDSPSDAASRRGPLGGRVRHVRHHRRLRDP